MAPRKYGLLPLFSSIVTFSGLTNAFFRMQCQERSGMGILDPLVDTGHIGSHSHVFHGGNNFGFSTTPQDLLESDCTSCIVKQDKSAYWSPALYFQPTNGELELVQQVGGMLAYYLLYPNPTGNQSITAFPTGFAMLAGNPYRRNFTLAIPDPPKSDWSGEQVTQDALQQKAVGFNCLDYSKTPEGTLYRHFLPTAQWLFDNCPDGLRLEMMFPSCWNGKDLNPPDHQSHMAYPNLVMTGTCPEGFDVKVPSILFETIWNTAQFAGKQGQFVLANGDATGHGYHADFMPAWPQGLLQEAVNTCTNPSGQVQDCPLFELQSQEEAATCTFPMPEVIKTVNYEGPVQTLPGGCPIQTGPSQATPNPNPAVGGLLSLPSSFAPAKTSVQLMSKPTLGYSAGNSASSPGYSSATQSSMPSSSASSSSASSSSMTKAIFTPAAYATPDAYSVTSIASMDSAAPTTGPAVDVTYITEGSSVLAMYKEEVVVTTTIEAHMPALEERHAYHGHQHAHHARAHVHHHHHHHAGLH